MALSLVTAPTTEPLTLDEVRLHLRLDETNEDSLLNRLIVAARRHVEGILRRALITQTWRLSLDHWPACEWIEVPLPPLQSVSSITYVDSSGTTQTWSASAYTVDTYSEPGRIALAYGEVWPALRDVVNPITVQYVAGYGAASAVPDTVKSAMLLAIGHWYAHREAVVQGGMMQLPMAVEALLDSARWGSYV